jgi:hypothetical protein
MVESRNVEGNPKTRCAMAVHLPCSRNRTSSPWSAFPLNSTSTITAFARTLASSWYPVRRRPRSLRSGCTTLRYSAAQSHIDSLVQVSSASSTIA